MSVAILVITDPKEGHGIGADRRNGCASVIGMVEGLAGRQILDGDLVVGGTCRLWERLFLLLAGLKIHCEPAWLTGYARIIYNLSLDVTLSDKICQEI